ncbi:VOC family protein [Jiella sp. M17.18]|uniref:VOC family protein n=1 Tax=Jiella sp. M17.18 TaxID=3234247 RepID=UPI0034DEE3A3
MTPTPAQFVWYELTTTDSAAAGAFYNGVIGWERRDSGMPGVSYTLFSAAGRDVGGMMEISAEMRDAGVCPAWTGYVHVDDVDRAAESFRSHGGHVRREPGDIPGVGRFAVVADPHGAVITLFKSEGPGEGPPPQGTIGHVGWRELLAGDLDQAFGFYNSEFGWQKGEAVDMGAMGVYQLFTAGADAIGGMMTKPAAVPAPFWLYYFQVDGIDAAAARVTAGGGTIANGPHQVPGGSWIVHCRDPEGVMFALVAAGR